MTPWWPRPQPASDLLSAVCGSRERESWGYQEAKARAVYHLRVVGMADTGRGPDRVTGTGPSPPVTKTEARELQVHEYESRQPGSRRLHSDLEPPQAPSQQRRRPEPRRGPSRGPARWRRLACGVSGPTPDSESETAPRRRLGAEMPSETVTWRRRQHLLKCQVPASVSAAAAAESLTQAGPDPNIRGPGRGSGHDLAVTARGTGSR